MVNARLLETETAESVVAERVEMRKIPINRGYRPITARDMTDRERRNFRRLRG